MVYPAVLLMLATGVIIFLMVFFIPRFKTLFASFDAGLPVITQLIVGASDGILHYGLYHAGGNRRRRVVCPRPARERAKPPRGRKRVAAHAHHRPAGVATRDGALFQE